MLLSVFSVAGSKYGRRQAQALSVHRLGRRKGLFQDLRHLLLLEGDHQLNQHPEMVASPAAVASTAPDKQSQAPSVEFPEDVVVQEGDVVEQPEGLRLALAGQVGEHAEEDEEGGALDAVVVVARQDEV